MESKKINQLATELAPDLSDLTIIGDPTTGISKKITLSQMASLFTGTVEEYANLAAFPLVGVADTIYIALDTNILYRWNTGTSAYVELSPNIVSSLVFNDANGFDGTINLVGSVATLTITTALTTGSVGFIGASGALLQDNANFFWDDTNNRLGLGTNAPTTALDVFGSGIIGRLNGTSTNNAYLGFASAGTNKWSVGNVQSDHRFRIFSEANSAELISVLQTGEVGIGIANPLTKFHIDGAASALIANLDANVSVAKSLSFRSDNSNRINLEVSGTESGSNAGADFFIRRYSDAGSLIDTPLAIKRSTGNVGIGINNAATQLEIYNSSTLSGFRLNTSVVTESQFTLLADLGTGYDNAGYIYAVKESTSNSYLSFGNKTATALSEKLRISSTGNVAIGTISPNIGGYGGNGRILTIQGVSGSYGVLELTSNSANADGSAIGRLDFGSDGQAANYKAISSIASFLSGSTSTKFGADLRFYTRANNAGTGDPIERMRITSAGLVGIDTTDMPYGKVTIKSNSPTSYAGLNVFASSNNNFIALNHTGSLGIIESEFATGGAYTPIAFVTSAGERMRITTGGELCLNTTSALGAGLFSLQGLTTAYNLIAIKDTGTTYSGTNNNFIYFMQSTGGTCGSISHSTATTVNYYSGPSDARKKENIQDWSQEVLPLFEDIKPKTYNHIEDYDSSYVYKGYMAQDMVDKFPEAYGLDKDGYYTFNPSGYIPYLVKAIQEQTKINKQQQAEIEELKAKIK
jgi:hypothetical protein